MTNYPYNAPSGQPTDYGTPAPPYGQPSYGQAPYQQQPYGSVAPAPYGYGQPQVPARNNNEVVIWSIVGAVVALMVLVLAPVLLIGKASHDFGNSMESLTGGATQQILDDDLDVTLGKYSRDTNEYSSGGTMKITLKNKSDKRSSFTVEVEAVTSSGERITTASQFANSLGAGQSVSDELRFTVSDDQERDLSNATFNVISVTKF